MRTPGRADPHIHTLASDGVDSVEAMLDAAVARGLDVIAITDHERIDAAVAAQHIAQVRGLPIEVIVGEEITTRNGHLVALFLKHRVRPWGSMRDSIARVHDQGGIAIVAHPLVPYPLCASERTIRRLLDEPDPRVHPDAIEAFNPTTAGMRWARRVPAFVAETGVAAVGGSDAHRAASVGRVVTTFPGHTTDDLRAAIASRETSWEGEAYAWREQVGMFRQQTGKNLRALRDEVRGKLLRDGTGRDLGYPGGRARRCAGTRAARTSRRRPLVKIGLVTPYIYPLPGGVNAHVQYLYENLVARGHDVRIISSTHGPQRPSEGDIIRLGYGWSVPTNGSVGTLTVSHRYGELVQEMLDREQFDLLHFHEPFVPFLSLQLLRHSTSVNVATFHAYSGWSPSVRVRQADAAALRAALHGRIAVSAAARHFIERYFPGDYKVIPNGVDLTRLPVVPPFARWRDGTLNILYVGRFENRKGAMYLLKAYRQLRREGIDCRLLVVGAGRRSARCGATSPRGAWAAWSCSAGSATRTRCGRSRPRTSTCPRRPARNRSASCCWRRWRPARPSSAATSTATRAWCGAASRRCWCRRRMSTRSTRP